MGNLHLENEAVLLYCYFSFNYQIVRGVVTQRFKGGNSQEKSTWLMEVEEGNLKYKNGKMYPCRGRKEKSIDF